MTAVLTLPLYSLPLPRETVDLSAQIRPSPLGHTLKAQEVISSLLPVHPCSEMGAMDTVLPPLSQVGRGQSQPLCNTVVMPSENGVISGVGPDVGSHTHGHTPAALPVSCQAHGGVSHQLGKASPLPLVHPRSAFWGAGGKQVHEDRLSPTPPEQQQLCIDEGAEPR